MSNLAERIKGIDLVGLCQAEGVQLRRSGRYWIGLCPLHPEKTPSFTIRDSRFRCYGCGSYGNSIDFIRQLKGLSFKEALSYLGIEISRPISRTEKKEVETRIKTHRQKQALVKAFRAWECTYSSDLGRDIREAYAWIRANIKCPDDLAGEKGVQMAEMYHKLPVWEGRLQILAVGSDRGKFELFKEVMGG